MKIRTLILSSIFICCFLMSTAHVQAQSYAKQVAKGEELVQAFGRLMEQNAGIDALEEMAVRISQNYQARLLLKNKYPDLGRVYHNMWLQGQHSLSQRMISKARTRLRSMGYSGQAVDDLQVISNVASAREMKAPMDLDIGVSTMGREQTRQFIRELRDQGKSPQTFLDDLQQALDQAYREEANEAQVLGVDPRRAFVTGTAAWHPEAYADLDVLNELPPGRTLVEQTVDVSRRKVNEMRILADKGVLTMDEAILEAGRGTLKDVRKLRAGFVEIERVYGISPELKGTNAWVVDQLEKLARGDLLPQQAAAMFQARGLNIFDACNQVMDQLETVWKLAPVSKPQGMLMALFRNYLPQDTYMDFVRVLKGEGIENVSGRAGKMVRQLRNMIGANFVSLQGAEAGKFIASFKAQYTDVIFEAGDKKLADLLDYLRRSTGLDELSQVVGEAMAVKLARIKALVPDLAFPKSASRFITNNIPLPSVDRQSNRLILGDVDSNLNMEALTGVALCLYEMNGIIDQGLPPEEETQKLNETFARNLPIVGDFFQGVVDGHAGYLEGDRQKMAQSAAYLFIGAAGLVPGGQVPALVAGLGMASIQLGVSAWEIGREKTLIQAVLDSGVFDPDQGRLETIWTREGGETEPEFTLLVMDGEWHFRTGLSKTTIRDAVYDWGQRYFLAGAREFDLLKQGFVSMYPDFDLGRNLREKLNTGRSLLAARILERGGTPRRDAAMALFVQMKRIYDQAGQAALGQIVDVAEQEYQARHHTGQALEIYRELRALGQRLRLPLVENTDKIFNSFSSFAQKALASPWVRESLRLQKVNLQKRYLEGYLQIEAQIANITQRMGQMGVNPPRNWNLTGFLEIDGPRMQDLENAYLSQGLNRARKDAMTIRKKAGQEGNLDLAAPCDAQLFQKLAKIRISLVHRQDLNLLMAQWQGIKSAAKQSRDQALAQAEQEITDQTLLSAVMDRLAKAEELSAALESAAMPWSGGYEVYARAREAVQEQIVKLEQEYARALERGVSQYLSCLKQSIALTDKAEKVLTEQTDDQGPGIDGDPSAEPAATEQNVSISRLSFAGSVPAIWEGGNKRQGFGFKWTEASKENSDKKHCPGLARLNAQVWGKINPSFAPRSQEEIIQKLQEEVEYHNKRKRGARIRPLTLSGFKGYFFDTQVTYNSGSSSFSGYRSGGVLAMGHGFVLQGKNCIELGYKANGSGCYNNSDRPFLESQAAAAQAEAKAIIAGLRLEVDGTFTKTPHAGPLLDGSDLLQVELKTAVPGPYRSGQIVELQAAVSGGKAPYTYAWKGNLGTSGRMGATASFAATNPGTYQVRVAVQDSAGSQAEADLSLEVGALQAELMGVLPDVVYGQTAVLSVDIEGGLPGGGSGYQSVQVGENQAYVPNPDEEDDGPGLVYIWQASPELQFADGVTTVPWTKVTYDRMGAVKIWAQVLSQEGGTRSTIGETPQVLTTVQAPAFRVAFSPTQSRVGQEVKARIVSEPAVPEELIDYRWFSPPSSNRMEYSNNSGQIGFTVPESGRMELHALARVPVHGDEISEIKATYSGSEYEVRVSVQESGPPAMTWDPQEKGLVQATREAYAVDARIVLQAELLGEPVPSSVRWQWTVNEGTFISNPISSTPTVSRSEPGTLQARVEVRDKAGILLGAGSISLPVVVQPDTGSGDQAGKTRKTEDEDAGRSSGPNSLSLSRTVFAPNQEVIVRFTAGQDLPPKAWVGVIPSGVPHGSAAENDKHDLAYRYVQGQTAGEMTFKAPKKEGEYDLRMSVGATDEEVASVSFQVVVPVQGAELILPKEIYAPEEKITVRFSASEFLDYNAWVGLLQAHIPHGSATENDAHDMAYSYVHGQTSGEMTFKAPKKEGEYDLRMSEPTNDREITSVPFSVAVPTEDAQLILPKKIFAPGQEIMVKFTASPLLHYQTWVGLLPAPIPHGSSATNDKHDLAYRYLHGQSSGEMTFKAPKKEGEYDLRMSEPTNDREVTSSAVFTVQGK